jgi:hypothetical protein
MQKVCTNPEKNKKARNFFKNIRNLSRKKSITWNNIGYFQSLRYFTAPIEGIRLGPHKNFFPKKFQKFPKNFLKNPKIFCSRLLRIQ